MEALYAMSWGNRVRHNDLTVWVVLYLDKERYSCKKYVVYKKLSCLYVIFVEYVCHGLFQEDYIRGI